MSISMNLKDFIAATVEQILSGVSMVSKRTGKNASIYSEGKSNQRHIEFDVAITVEDKNSQSKEGGIKLRVLEFNSKGKNEHKDSSVSRVKFGIRIHDK